VPEQWGGGGMGSLVRPGHDRLRVSGDRAVVAVGDIDRHVRLATAWQERCWCPFVRRQGKE